MLKRLFDICAATFGLVLLAPLLFALAVAIRLSSEGPIFFRQQRVGRFGKPFHIHKFRTMYVAAERQGLLTVGEDGRITRVGRVLRKYKLDELPQLIDVLRGEMSLVGPRPEVQKYVDHYSAADKELVLSVRPGITDEASIQFRDEAAMLGAAADPELVYINEVLPIKLAYYRRYALNPSLIKDLTIIARTVAVVLIRPKPGCSLDGLPRKAGRV